MPIEYYRNNIDSTLTLLDAMKAHGVHNIIFSSSATVYGAPDEVPIKETAAVGRCTNPYGWTKYMIEVILKSASVADPSLSVVLLRYFNPVGAHESGLIGETPGHTNNLMPYITQVAVRKAPSAFGFRKIMTQRTNGVRDYITHRIAKGHVASVGMSVLIRALRFSISNERDTGA